MIIDSLRGDESVKPVSPIKTCDKGKVLGNKENFFADEEKSDVNSGNSLAEIEVIAACTSSLRPRSSEEESGESRLNLAPPKLEAEGDEWQCGVCRVIVRGRPKPISNDAGIPKCMACDLKTQSFVQAGVAPPAGVVASIKLGVSAPPGNASMAAPQNLSTGTQFTCCTGTKVQLTQKAAQSRRCWQGCSDVGRSRAGGLGRYSSAKFEHDLEQL
jgi:hypothetical protein